LLINGTFQTTASVLFDAVYVAGGAASVATRQQDANAVRFVNEAYRHCKSIAASAAGIELLKAAAYPGAVDILGGEGVVTSTDTHVAELATAFIAAIAQHRFWNRELRAMPA
jgi:catalase